MTNPVTKQAISDIVVQGADPKKPHCGLFAIAMLSGYSIEQVAEFYRSVDPKKGNWQGRTYFKHLEAVIRRLGFKVTNIEGAKGITVRKYFSNPNLDPDDWIMVETRGHFFSVSDGLARDQVYYHDVKSGEFSNNRKRIIKAIRISAA